MNPAKKYRRVAIALTGLLMSLQLSGQPVYRVEFTDKKGSPWSLRQPQQFLSERAIARRERQQIPLDETDLPVNQAYIDQVLKTGASLLHSSKWLNSITVTLPHDTLAATIRKLSFVNNVQLTKPAMPLKSASLKLETTGLPGRVDSSFYGQAIHQIAQLNGQLLHRQGFRGKEIHIAVLDAGFFQVDRLPAFDTLWQAGRILGTRDFVHPQANIFEEHPHGMMVLSTMGANLPGRLVGTAPEASYWLLRSEDAATEYPVEEDNWIAAAEFADSVGADIINSSLGYSTFDLAEMNHTYAELDGQTTRVAKAANLAAQKGMMVFASAGNEGNKSWRHIVTPADGDQVIAVAAVNKEGVRAPFSSVGPAPGGAVKPNLAALGWGAAVTDTDGTISLRNGTSFSSPVLAGMTACLWQLRPAVSASQLKAILYYSGHQRLVPDSLLGFGIPDFERASAMLLNLLPQPGASAPQWAVFPNPAPSFIHLWPVESPPLKTDVEISGINGVVVFRQTFYADQIITIRLNSLTSGVWLLKITSGKGTEIHKIVKP